MRSRLILWVEPAPDVFDDFKLLSGMGHEVVSTTSSTVAVNFARSRSFEAIFIDSRMTETVEQIRQFDNRTPIYYFKNSSFLLEQLLIWQSEKL